MALAELTTATATGLAALVASRAASAREVVEAHLRRIEAVNGAINAVVALDAERALAAAGRADTALARGEPTGPLHGVPFTVKDNIAAAGLPMAIGAPERAGVVPDGDATVVARMRAAGAILLGKTNLPAVGRRHRDRQPGVRPRPHPRRQQRRRGRDRRRGDRPLRHVAGGTADRRAGRGRGVAGRRRPGRGRAARRRPRRVPPAAALISPRTSSGRTARRWPR